MLLKRTPRVNGMALLQVCWMGTGFFLFVYNRLGSKAYITQPQPDPTEPVVARWWWSDYVPRLQFVDCRTDPRLSPTESASVLGRVQMHLPPNQYCVGMRDFGAMFWIGGVKKTQLALGHGGCQTDQLLLTTVEHFQSVSQATTQLNYIQMGQRTEPVYQLTCGGLDWVGSAWRRLKTERGFSSLRDHVP